MPSKDAGLIDIGMQTTGKNLFSELFRSIIAQYMYLPDVKRRLVRSEDIVKKQLDAAHIDETAMVSTLAVYDDILRSKRERAAFIQNQIAL